MRGQREKKLTRLLTRVFLLSLFSTACTVKLSLSDSKSNFQFYFVLSVPVLLKQQSRERWRQISWTCAVMNRRQTARTVRSWKRVPRRTPAAFTSLTHMSCSFVCLLPQRSSCRQLSLWVIITAVFVREWRKMRIFHAGTTEHSNCLREAGEQTSWIWTTWNAMLEN